MAEQVNIQHGDVVRHRDGKTYRVSEVTRTEVASVKTVNIAREGEGSVFHGTPQQAREQGFAFGEEQFLSNGRPISHYDIPAMVDSAERAFIGVEVGELGHRNIVQFAISAGVEVGRLQGMARQNIYQRQAAESALAAFKEEVRDAIIAAAKEHDLCREGTNTVLENLGLPKWKKAWTVTVTRDSDGETILTVTGVEADTEDEATEYVKGEFSVTATVKEVRFDYSYDGEGDADWDEEDWTDDDFDEGDDDHAENHKDGLTFSAEEE